MARVSKAVQEINHLLEPDNLSGVITAKYQDWRNNKMKWVEASKELRNYVFQTDTTDTSNVKLPWKNKTSIPKICQIRDNLHANYFAALFPHDDWFKWEAATTEASDKETAALIESYMKQKIRESNFKKTISDLLYDYIDSGNAFGEVNYENDNHTLDDGSVVNVYNGPKAFRISPYDIYFDVTASSFDASAKITRTIVSLGTLKKAAETDPAYAWANAALGDTVEARTTLSSFGDSDLDKSDGLTVDGFGSINAYYSSDMVELLEFEGDAFDPVNGTILSGHRIIVMDRRKVVYNEPMESWLGKSNKEHVGWRPRPDNLMAMGPLDNLVGMQYRLDHLENLKADVFDQIAHPVVYQRGVVEEWNWGPGERIYGDIDSEVRILAPDTTALNADFQMRALMDNMEDLVGAPKHAMGVRTPGEKTAFEVQSLDNNAGRIFQHKVHQFEEGLVEPLLNQMLESARRNLNATEQVKVIDGDFGVAQFQQITPEQIGAKGKLYPIGARHFAKQAQVVQNLNGLANSAVYGDPAVNAHISGLKIAQLFEEQLGLQKFELVEENIRVAEQQETQASTAQSQEAVATEILDKDG